MNQVVAGIDIGGTNTAFGLVSESGKVLLKGTQPTRSFPDAKTLVETVSEAIHAQVRELSRTYPGLTLTGAGVGAPNANPFRGTVEYAPNLNWHGVVPLRDLFSTALGVHTELTNDAKAAALGEQTFGAARGCRDFIVITLGTGLGSGIVANGQLVYGHEGFAGELGHVIVVPNGRLCGCGRKGCLETYCSATGIVRTYRELKPEAPPEADAREITRLALSGEAEAREAYRLTGEVLGQALANFAAVTQPEKIILFGGLVKAGDLLMSPLKSAFESNLLPLYRNKIQLIVSALHESDAALLGAASLVFNRSGKIS